MKLCLQLVLLLLSVGLSAQNNGEVRASFIKQPQLFQQNNQYSYPIIQLGAVNALELHFDDSDNRIKNYSYTYQLCDANWKPVALSQFDFIRGFTQNRLTQYRPSSIARARYIHYQAQLPDARSMPSLSGNYLLKVFLDGDTAKTVFTRKMLVVEPVLQVGASIQQPFNPQQFRTHQKLLVGFDLSKLTVLNPREQVKLVILPNYRWDVATSYNSTVLDVVSIGADGVW